MGADVAVIRSNRQEIAEDSDGVLARKTAEAIAADVGFDDTITAEIGLVTAELSSNVNKHAETGEVTISEIRKGDRSGIRIESLDVGPGIDDVDGAFANGVSTAGTLGGGLGTVNRLMDEVTVDAPGEPDYGTHVIADRYLEPAYESTVESPLEIGAASRPKTAGDANGDSFILKRWNDTVLVGVIDGLGHGERAHKAAMAAKEYVESHYDSPISSIFEGTERVCRGTRGVVMALARFDLVAATVTVGSVGNIAIKTDSEEGLGTIPRRGVLGSNGPDPAVTTADWDENDRFVMFSDGVESHWNLHEHTDLFTEPATVVARRLLGQYGKDHDDGTIVVVGPLGGGS